MQPGEQFRARIFNIYLLSFFKFSICGFNNALVFRKVEDSMITSVEKFMQESFERAIHIAEDERPHFFGISHTLPAAEFTIPLGDKFLLIEIAAYADRMTREKGSEHFRMDEKLLKPYLARTKMLSIGRVFAAGRKNIGIGIGNADLRPKIKKTAEELTNTLHKRVKDIMCSSGTFDEITFSLQYPPDKLIKVEQKCNIVKGQVTCVLCEQGKGENKASCAVKVSYFAGASSEYWVLSNFERHLATHDFQITKRRRRTRKSKVIDDAAETDENANTNKTGHRQTKIVTGDLVQIGDLAGAVEAQVDEPGGDGITQEQLEQDVYDLFNDRNMEIVESILINGDEEFRMEYDLNEIASSDLMVARMHKDGNCLFSSLAHQINSC